MTAFLSTMLGGMLMTSTSSTLTGLLSDATEMFTWFITSMTSLVTFIIGNPIVMAGFLILLSGAVVGMFMRIWKSA